MRKLLLLSCLLTPSLAMAQIATPPPGTPPPPAQSGPPGQGPHFEEMKARMTERLQTALACVQAAQNAEAMRACRPKKPDGGGPGGEETGGGPPPGTPNAWTQRQTTGATPAH